VALHPWRLPAHAFPAIRALAVSCIAAAHPTPGRLVHPAGHPIDGGLGATEVYEGPPVAVRWVDPGAPLLHRWTPAPPPPLSSLSPRAGLPMLHPSALAPQMDRFWRHISARDRPALSTRRTTVLSLAD
jgi:hypothetical protein